MWFHSSRHSAQFEYGVALSQEKRLQLTLNVMPSMTWSMWWYVVNGLKDFIFRYQYVAVDFEVLSGEHRASKGLGSLVIVG